MKKHCLFLVVVLMLSLFSLSSCSTASPDSGPDTETNAPEDVVISFRDANFEVAVRGIIQKPTGDIMQSDVAKVVVLDVTERDIADLSGIEYFTALEKLHCDSNQLTALDVSKNTALIELDCSSNQLTTLDLHNNTALDLLWCFGNKITTLDLSKNIALTRVFCEGNELTALIASDCKELVFLQCSVNKLTTLDVSNCVALQELSCALNNLTELDVSTCLALTRLQCPRNNFSSRADIIGLDESRTTVEFDPQGNNF